MGALFYLSQHAHGIACAPVSSLYAVAFGLIALLAGMVSARKQKEAMSQ